MPCRPCNSPNFAADQKTRCRACTTPSSATDRGERLVRNVSVDLDQRDGVAAGLLAAEMEGRDVVALLAEQRAEPADEAGLVAVGDVEHVRPELGLHVDALDLDDARLAVGENRAGDGALLLLGDDGQADVALIGAGLAAARLLDLDAALLREGRRGDHVHRLQHAAAESRRAPPRSARGHSCPRPRLRIRA